jgi:hypothetical protein
LLREVRVMKKLAVVASVALLLAGCGEGIEEGRGIPSDGMRNLTATSSAHGGRLLPQAESA